MLAKLDAVKMLLAKAYKVEDVRDIRDKAEALRTYAKAAGLGLEDQNKCAEIKLRAERKAGELLPSVIQLGGNAKTRHASLSTLGLEDTQSQRWQFEATVPEDEFERYVVETCEAEKELTSVGLLRLAAQLRPRKKPNIPPAEGEYNVVIVDPPWPYQNRQEDDTHRARNPYPPMSIDEIKALVIPEAGDCILWLWTTNAFMHDAYHVLEAWNFTPKTILTWEKDRMGLGDWLRGKTEHCILSVKGSPRIKLTNQTTIIHGPMREHSRKPSEFYDLVKELCPGKRIDMFSREPHDGFEQWGNEPTFFAEAVRA